MEVPYVLQLLMHEVYSVHPNRTLFPMASWHKSWWVKHHSMPDSPKLVGKGIYFLNVGQKSAETHNSSSFYACEYPLELYRVQAVDSLSSHARNVHET